MSRQSKPRRYLTMLITLAAYLVVGEPVARGGESGLELQVLVHGLRSNQGRVAVALFADADSFPDQRRALRGRTVPVTAPAGKNGVRVNFSGLAPGIYAIAVLHDENGNDKMDFNWIGMPLEGYGFSRDAAVLFGPPSFSAAALRVSQPRSVTRVQARYFSL